MTQYGSVRPDKNTFKSYTPWWQSKEYLQKKADEAEAAKQAEIDRQGELAEEERKNNTLWGRTKGFVGGVGETAIKGVVGAGKLGVETVQGVGDFINVNSQLEKDKKYEKDRNEYLKQFLGDETKYLEELNKYNEKNEDKKGKVKEAFEKQDSNAEEYTKAAQDFYKLAQYVPGVSMGVETAGTIGAKFQGDDGEINKRLIELTQSLDWDNLTDEEKKQALIQRDLGGALSMLDVIPGVGKAAKAGTKVALKSGLKEGAKAAAKTYGKSIAGQSIKDIASVGAKQLAKQGFKSGVKGAVSGAVIGVGMNEAMGGEDWGNAAAEGAKSGFIGGFLSSPMDIDIKNIAGAVNDAAADAARVAELDIEANKWYVDNTAKEAAMRRNVDAYKASLSEAGDGTKLLAPGRTTTKTVVDIEGELLEVQTGTGRYADSTPEIRKARFAELQEELPIAQRNADTKEFVIQDDIETNTTRPAEAVDVEADAIAEGDLPDTLKTAQEPVHSVATILFSENMPVELKENAQKILNDQGLVSRQLDNLVTQEKLIDTTAKMDADYDAKVAEIEQMPPRRQEIEMEKLEKTYNEAIDNIYKQADIDAPEVEKFERIKEHLANKEMEIVNDTNAMMYDNPEVFAVPDKAKVADKLSKLKQEARINELTEGLPASTKQTVGSVDNGVLPSESKNIATQKAVETQILGNQNIGDVGNTGKNPSVWDIFLGRSKEVLAKFGEGGKRISKILDTATDTVAILDHNMNLQTRLWYDAAGGNKGMTSIAKALDGDSLVFSTLTQPQVKVFNQVRDMFKDYAKKLGLPENAKISEYLPHIFKEKGLDQVDAAIMQLKLGRNLEGKILKPAEISALNKTIKGIDYEALDMISRKGRSNWEVKNGFLQKRQGVEGYSFELPEIIATYTHAAHNTMHLKPAFELCKELSTTLSESQNKYLANVIHNIDGTPSDSLGDALDKTLENLMSKNKLYSSTGTKLLKLIHDATLEFNPGAALKNLTQGANTYAQLGEKYYAIGLQKTVQSYSKSNNLYSHALDYGVLHSRFSDLMRQGDTASIGMEKFHAAGWKMFTEVERINRSTAFFGEEARYLDNYMKTNKVTIDAVPKDVLDAAAKSGRAMSRETQFEFGALDNPVGLQSTTAKILTQFQSFNIAQVRMMKKMIYGLDDSMIVKNTSGTGYHMTAVGTKKVARLVGANLLLINTIGSAIGMKPTDMIPYFDEMNDATQVATGQKDIQDVIPKSPIVKLLLGDVGSVGVTDILQDVAGVGRTALGSTANLEDEGFTESVGKLVKDTGSFAKTAGSLLVPGGTQVKKTLDAVDTNIKGFSESSNGSIRFAQDRDPVSKLNSTIFGQYTTGSGKEWIKKGFPTLTPQQTEKIYNQKTKAAKLRYTKFYSSIKDVPGRSDVLEAAKEAQKTSPAKAQRLVGQHNAKVTAAMKAYYSEYDDLDKELQDYLDSYVKIKYKNVEN